MKKETSTNKYIANNYNYVPMATIQTPNYVGGYRLGGEYGVQFNFTVKPNWFHRTMIKLCLGWEWIDDKI
jgi:hypothetical protein